MDQEIKMSIAALIGIIAAIVGPVIGALVYMYKQRENTQKEILSLTKTFTESTNSQTRALENNSRSIDRCTDVIERLPDQIMLHAKAAGKLG